ncbi:NAD(P)-binding domain-containing protein [Boseaceae bacterium BT-24-1]|nr:NAD(P)-binding domain-containing protein [Boseaceae bacterium BT-24-1]
MGRLWSTQKCATPHERSRGFYRSRARALSGEQSMSATVSVIGLGRMGSALAQAFLKAGIPTHVWNRSPEKAAALADQGAQIASSVSAAAAAADIVVVCVSTYADSDRLFRVPETAAALRDKLIVQVSSGSPNQAREQAKWAADNGTKYLDGAIMATPNFIGEPGGTILYSGPQALFEANRPILLALGGNPQFVGEDVGHASALDLSLLGQMWGALFGQFQAAAICEAEGIALDLFEGHRQAFLPVVEGAVVDLITRIRDRRFAADTQTLASLDVHYGAFGLLLQLCAERGLHDLVPKAYDSLFRKAIDAGHRQDDFAAIAQFMR